MCARNATRKTGASFTSPRGDPARDRGRDPGIIVTVTEDVLRELRGAIHRDDGESVVAWLADRSWGDLLQHAGDGLLVALAEGVAGAPERATACAEALRARGWTGDDELADQLEARRGGAAPMLRPLPVDLDELAGTLEGDPREPEGRIDRRTGEVWPGALVDPVVSEIDTGDEDDDPERWLRVDNVGSRDGYRDMVRYAEDVTDPDVADRLLIALDGRGAFRRFRDVLDRWPDRVDSWRTFAAERRRGRARAWLADEGYSPARP